MNSLVSAALLALVLVAVSGVSADQQKSSSLDSVSSPERQGRSIHQSNPSANMIDVRQDKFRLEAERRQVLDSLTLKNILKSVVKIIFGNNDEVTATSRHVLGVLSKVLDILKASFGQKSRSGQGRTLRDTAEEAASAGVTMLQGYVRSVLAQDEKCVQRYLCEASREASRESRDLGYIISSLGGYASSYLLDGSKQTGSGFKTFYDASSKGRGNNKSCDELFPGCSEKSE